MVLASSVTGAFQLAAVLSFASLDNTRMDARTSHPLEASPDSAIDQIARIAPLAPNPASLNHINIG